MSVSFIDTPDATGLGRVVVDGKFYGLPAAIVTQLELAWNGQGVAHESSTLTDRTGVVDAARWRAFIKHAAKEVNGEKGYIKFYLPRFGACGGFLPFVQAIDALVEKEKK